MTYKCGLTKTEYDELLNSFVTQFVERVVDKDELTYEARAELVHMLVESVDADGNTRVEIYCARHGVPVNSVTYLLESLKTIWAQELLAETGQMP